MKAIVTGASGFVGSALVKKLVQEGIDVLCIDHKKRDNLDNEKIKSMVLSVENIEELETKINFGEYNMFYHFAWVGSAGPLRTNEKVQVRNAMWTVKCLRTANKIGCKKFIVAGSIMEYEVHSVMYSQGTKPALPYI